MCYVTYLCLYVAQRLIVITVTQNVYVHVTWVIAIYSALSIVIYAVLFVVTNGGIKTGFALLRTWDEQLIKINSNHAGKLRLYCIKYVDMLVMTALINTKSLMLIMNPYNEYELVASEMCIGLASYNILKLVLRKTQHCSISTIHLSFHSDS